MQALVKRMEAWSPGFAATLTATPEDDIKALATVAGPLPGAYLRFLRTMGASTGDLELDHGNADLRSDENWPLYDDQKWLHGSPYVYIGQDRSPNGMHYFLDRRSPHGDVDCLVVTLPLDPDLDEDRPELIHAGLEEMMYYEAFYGLRLPLFEHHRELLQPRVGTDPAQWPQPSTLCQTVERLGFQRIPPATRCALYERGDAAVLMYQRPTRPVFRVILATERADELARLTQALVDAVGLTVNPNPVF
jgi:hypothetical protein